MMERYELKFLLTQAQSHRLEGYIAERSVPDPNAADAYNVQSTYFDTPDWRCYFDKQDGVCVRQKYRFRTYNDAIAAGHFELKYRYGEKISKQRIAFDTTELMDLAAAQDGEAHREVSQTGSPKAMVCQLFHQQQLRPTHRVAYRRRAHMVPHDPPFRITFDHDIVGMPDVTHTDVNAPAYALCQGYVVMEIKIHEQLPLWVYQIIKDMQLVSRSFSKYALTVQLLGITGGAS